MRIDILPSYIMESILLKRDIARGDVLLCTAIIRQLKMKYPEAKVYFETHHPELFDGSRLVDGAWVPAQRPADIKFTKTYDLNVAIYEKFRGWHIIDCFASCCDLKRGSFPKTTEMSVIPEHSAMARASLNGLQDNDFIVIAAGPGKWEGRNWPEGNWRLLIDELVKAGEKIVLVGSETDYATLSGTLDLRGKTPEFGHLAGVINRAKCFIGIDSGPMHVAGALKVPRVALFGVTLPDLILCDSPQTIAVRSDPNHRLSGIRHSVNYMSQINLKHPKQNPMRTISLDQVMKAYRTLFPV